MVYDNKYIMNILSIIFKLKINKYSIPNVISGLFPFIIQHSKKDSDSTNFNVSVEQYFRRILSNKNNTWFITFIAQNNVKTSKTCQVTYTYTYSDSVSYTHLDVYKRQIIARSNHYTLILRVIQ